MAPKTVPKLIKKLMILGSIFGSLFVEVLERLSWEASGPQKNLKNQLRFYRFLKIQLFGSLKLLMALLGSSCFFLGKSGAKMGFQNGYQKWSLKTLKIEFKIEVVL